MARKYRKNQEGILPEGRGIIPQKKEGLLSKPANLGALAVVAACSAGISYGIDKFLASGIYVPAPLGGKIRIMEKMGMERKEEISRSLIAGVSGSIISLGITVPILKIAKAEKAIVPAAIGGILNIIGWVVVGCIKYNTWVKPKEEPLSPGQQVIDKAQSLISTILSKRPKWVFKGVQVGNRIVWNR